MNELCGFLVGPSSLNAISPEGERVGSQIDSAQAHIDTLSGINWF